MKFRYSSRMKLFQRPRRDGINNGISFIALAARFFSRVRIQKNGCWEWTGSTAGYGYGKFHLNTKPKSTSKLAHRFSYEMSEGEIPPGMTIDHVCRNRKCVNPDHLDCVTQQENWMKGNGREALKKANEALPPGELQARAHRASLRAAEIKRAQTHCKRGHEFTPENTSVRERGTRGCRTCERRKQQEARDRRKLDVFSKLISEV